MLIDYGFKKRENELVNLFRSSTPDFERAEKLLAAGADINALSKNLKGNILSEILSGYWYCWEGEGYQDKYNLKPEIGLTMCRIIRFFLSNGFDVNKNGGTFGAQCLHSLVISTFDDYMLEATKMLFDAGAKNRTISDSSDEDETPRHFVAAESSFQYLCEGDHSLGNIYEALYQIYQAVDEGLPYHGINTYRSAVGKRILKVLACTTQEEPAFYSLNLPEADFSSNLYFVFEGGVLIVTRFANFWVDIELPQGELIDVSECFPGIVGERIKNFSFKLRTIFKEDATYTQPVTHIQTESGKSLSFFINFGNVQYKYRSAFLELES